MPVFVYEGLYLGQLLVLRAPPEELQIRFSGRVDVQRTVSRDGVHWQRADLPGQAAPGRIRVALRGGGRRHGGDQAVSVRRGSAVRERGGAGRGDLRGRAWRGWRSGG